MSSLRGALGESVAIRRALDPYPSHIPHSKVRLSPCLLTFWLVLTQPFAVSDPHASYDRPILGSGLSTTPTPNTSGLTEDPGPCGGGQRVQQESALLSTSLESHDRTKQWYSTPSGETRYLSRTHYNSSYFPNRPSLLPAPHPFSTSELAHSFLPHGSSSRGSRRSKVVLTDSSQPSTLVKFPSTYTEAGPFPPVAPPPSHAPPPLDRPNGDCAFSRYHYSLAERSFYGSHPWPSLVTYMCIIVIETQWVELFRRLRRLRDDG